MKYGDAVNEIPGDFVRTGTADCPSIEIQKRKYTVSSSTEVRHSVYGYMISPETSL